MNLVNYLQFLEPVQDHVAQVYSTTSEIITVILVIWCINFVAGMIHRTYASGYAFGLFYRSYIHPYLKAIVYYLFKALRLTISKNEERGVNPARQGT